MSFLSSREITCSAVGNLLPSSPPIGQTLASDPLKSQISAVRIAVAKRRAGVVAETEFLAVALQVLRGNVVEGTDQTALEHREEALNRVRVSDAAHLMAQGEPFAACYWDTTDGRVFGLRATDDGIDVSEVAKLYGGGGHAKASGFKVPRGHALAIA